MQTTWNGGGWEADYLAGVLVLTHPNGDLANVSLMSTATRRNNTLAQFRSSVKSHGVVRACETFWKLRAKG